MHIGASDIESNAFEDDTIEDYEPVENQSTRWSLKNLRLQFEQVKIEHVYQGYIRRLNYGYFSLYLILQALLYSSYLIAILIDNGNKPIDGIIPVLIAYGSATILAVLSLFMLSENLIKTSKCDLLKYSSVMAFLITYAIDAVLPVYQYVANGEKYRTQYVTHIIIACYIFLSLGSLWAAFATALLATVSHLIICGLITFSDYTVGVIARKLAIELVYLVCIHGLGLYFRYMNEIMYRRSFLDKKDGSDMKMRFDHESSQREFLLDTIIPSNITAKFRNDSKLFDKFCKIDPNNKLEPYDFKQLLTYHENVTILYADIVNYTQMTTTIKPSHKLVEALNALFGNIDDDAEKLGVMRIKFLGDCYYGVSGLETGLESKRNVKHADACVQLGLRMINHIKRVNESKNIELNMRIGIHTGNLYACIIGLTRWQYEIWSDDVYFANKMESSGFPGMVHISNATRLQLQDTYNIVPTNVSEFDEDLSNLCQTLNYDPTTYVISPEPFREKMLDVNTRKKAAMNNSKYIRRQAKISDTSEIIDDASGSSVIRYSGVKKLLSFQEPVAEPRVARVTAEGDRRYSGKLTRRSENFNASLVEFNEVSGFGTKGLESDVNALPLSKYSQWFQEKEINPLFLLFKSFKTECEYIVLPDALFKYYIISVSIVLVCFISIRYIAIPEWENTTLLSLITAMILTMFTAILFLPNLITEKYHNVKPYIPKFFFCISEKIVDSALVRVTIYIILVGIFSACFVLELTHCSYDYDAFNALLKSSPTTSEEKCLLPWNITEIIGLTLIMSFVFLKIHLLLKLAYTSCVTIAYGYWIWFHAYEYYKKVETFDYMMQPPLAHIMCIVYLTVTLHFVDRQADYLNRLNHKWNRQLAIETEMMTKMRDINQTMLANVMPLDVAVKYYSTKREESNGKERKYYYELYDSVAVMFATIVEKEHDLEVPDRLMAMNSVIADFDQLLRKPQYAHHIDKIKLANRTYVAVAGLTPGRATGMRKSMDDAEIGMRTRAKGAVDDNLVLLVKFAGEMREALKAHNKEANLTDTLRIGICDGALTAGVVGTKKPHYDIWGDCVNMASRMDTTGAENHIQVTESTEMVLGRNGIKSRYNQVVGVKGKGYVHTYYVELDDQGQPIMIKDSDEE